MIVTVHQHERKSVLQVLTATEHDTTCMSTSHLHRREKDATMPMAQIGNLTLHYQVQGTGKPLLLIIGYRGSSILWGEEFLEPLAQSFQVITFDNRGTGLSDKPAVPYTIPMMADDAAGLLSYLGIARADVFGVSMGVMIAQELALRHPRRVKRLLLGCTMCGGPQAVVASPEVIARLLPAPEMPREVAIRRLWAVIFSPTFLAQQQAFLDRLTARALTSPTPFLSSIRQALAMQRFNTYGRLGQIVAPTLVVTGDADRLVPPAKSHLLAARIPGAALTSFAGAGHGFFWEHTQAMIRLLGDFCLPS